MGCSVAAREEFSSDQKLLSHWELQLRKLPPVLLAADPWHARGTQRSMLNPSTALVYLIHHKNERERNPSIGTVQGIRVLSNNRGLHPRNASNQKHYFSAITFGTQSDPVAGDQHGYPISGFISFPIS